MTQPSLEKLSVLRQFWRDSNGCVECCQNDDGEKQIRVSIDQPDLQRSTLLQIEKGAPAHMIGQRLDLFFPWQEGQGLDEWLFYQRPSLGQRREMCFSLMEQMLTQHFPADLTSLAARPENLRFEEDRAVLLILPKLGDWTHEMGETAVVQRTAKLMAESLNRNLLYQMDEIFPPELQLLLMRSESGEYRDWDQLYADLFRIPEQFSLRPRLTSILNRKLKMERFIPLAQRIIAAVLAILALTCVAFAVVRWQKQQTDQKEHGFSVIGQEILQEEDGT